MPRFQGTDFTIELPAGCSDESTYAFAFPSREDFRPSVVVKTERLSGPAELPVYAAEQLGRIREALPEVEVLEMAGHRCVYEFGDAAQRIRQVQRYILREDPWRVVVLTATASQAGFAEVEALIEAVFDSFRCLPRTEV